MPIVPVPALFTVQQAFQEGGRRVLTLQFAEPQLNTELVLDGTKVLTVRSGLIPSWRTSLLRAGVPPKAWTEARGRSASLFEAVQHLIGAGHLDTEDLPRLAHERLTSAFVPLYWNVTIPSLCPGSTDKPVDFVTCTPVQAALTEGAWYALSLSLEQRVLRPSDRFAGSLLWHNQLPRTPVEVIWHAAQQGLNLGQIAQRLPLRWDVLTDHVTDLVARRLLKRQTKVQASLQEAFDAG